MKGRFTLNDVFMMKAKLVIEKQSRCLVLQINGRNVLEVNEDGVINTNFTTVHEGQSFAGMIVFSEPDIKDS